MAESPTRETQRSMKQCPEADEPVGYVGELVLSETSRAVQKEPPNTRLYRMRYERYLAIHTGDADEKVESGAQEWVLQMTEKARRHDLFGGYEIRFDDLKIPAMSSQRGVAPAQPLPIDVGADDACLSAKEIIARLGDVSTSPRARQQLACEAELVRFAGEDRETLLRVLWQYISDYRDSNNRDELIAVGAAIRKYIAIMPMEQMGTLAELLEPGHRAPLPVELELEVAKMVYRNFEVHPPQQSEPHPDLAARLFEMAQEYVKPRFLVRDKHSAVASLAIEALVAMQSGHAEAVLRIALDCPYGWFSEMVKDDLAELRRRWAYRDDGAVAWLDNLCAAADI